MRWPFPCFPPVFCMQNSSLHLSTYGNPMKSLWHRHHPMKSPFCTKFPITIWPVKLLGFLGSFRFFFNPSPGNWPTNVRPILNKVPRGQMVQSWGKALGMQWNGSAGYNFCIWCCTCGSNVWADVFTLLFHLNLNGSSPTKSGFIIFWSM